MDILVPLLILAVLYLVPELLRKRNPKNYKYPEIPNEPSVQVNIPKATIPAALNEKANSSSIDAKYQDNNVSSSYAKTNDVHGANESFHDDNNALVNGVIWSEILQPPRAYRPLINSRFFPRR